MRAEPWGSSRTCHRAAGVALSPLVPLIITRHLLLSCFLQQNWPFPLRRLNRQLTVEFSLRPGFASLCVQQQPQRIYTVKPPS